MSGERYTLDTNILVYAVDRDAGTRHDRAASLVDRAVDMDCVLTLQALSEFFAAVTRKAKMPATEAAAQVEDWQTLFPVAFPRSNTLQQAISAVLKHSLSFWDAMLWSVAKDAGVTVLYSEDFQNGRELGRVEFRNPFVGNEFPKQS